MCSVGLAAQLVYPSVAKGCLGSGVLLRDTLEMVDQWYSLGILRLIRATKIYFVLAFLVVGRGAERIWLAQTDQCWISYEHFAEKMISLPAEASMVRCSMDGGDIMKGGRLKLRLICHAEYAVFR